ncbi:hypothetical protein AB1A81_05660 [Bdellovibrio bacteriovorus]|uniref:Uncharacterized protein n=1 Tax=Bdellovibrio bacteriovorus (strain ATCC 15356 / DSM 50701 / NCIMB 9529 / HD100) TaxID=264462 RepID=Q6MNK8_BDEBA|nr:hypothetical protein [Bdellovibrio bacteriovorus]AHZ86457.1 hypothetical protein EP01_16165 [Bdellovibrio bacteriovorus]BEV67699.1 hypothetical protein Bb109J_c1119 [Bdellovibrio bacteriovorus]CAE79143.1 hypothetical protein predicted by Glimmer/Critica [Bdellovibrio bacteriovorus HD100]
MRNANVIEFPKAQSVRKRLQDKAQEQKAVLVLSIASVLLMTVFLNQWLVRGPDQNLANGGNRGVASFEPSSFAKDVKWEHDLAKRMATEKSTMAASLAEAPTLRDELVFGYLEGKYGMKLSQGRIESLEFIDAQAGEQPMAIEDKAGFLKKYSEAFGMNYAEVSVASNAEGEQVYSLIDSSKQIIGKAQFVTDDQGRVQAINFAH